MSTETWPEWNGAIEKRRNMTKLPPLPPHPEHHSMTWSSLERRAILEYARQVAEQVAEPLLARIALLEAKLDNEQEPIAWLPMETAPKDGTLIKLLVQFTDHSFEDDGAPNTTIGANTSTLTLETEDWKFAGWCWTHDIFTQGEGVPLGWLPLHVSAPAQPIASGQEPLGEREAFKEWAESESFEVKALLKDGRYWSGYTQRAWEAWQARAAHGIKEKP
jgi:hypothetical protein